MQIYKYKKRPDEAVMAEWSFDSRMAETETIVTRSAVATGCTISAVGTADNGRGVACLVTGGVDAANLVIKWGAVTSLGQTLFDEVILRVRADPFGTD